MSFEKLFSSSISTLFAERIFPFGSKMLTAITGIDNSETRPEMFAISPVWYSNLSKSTDIDGSPKLCSMVSGNITANTSIDPSFMPSTTWKIRVLYLIIT